MANKPSEQKLSRNDIIASVATLIAEQGLETLTMRNIARHVGCSVGTLPHYFDGKDDIVAAALTWSNERIFARIDSLPPNELTLETLYPLISASMPMSQQADTEWRVRLCLWDTAVTNEELLVLVQQTNHQTIEMLNHLVNYLQGSGEIKAGLEATTLATTLYHLCVGTGFNMLHLAFDERPDQLNPLFSYIESIRAT